jgi:uncharacterized membrane protein YphA (DoxX/SURF4 family)
MLNPFPIQFLALLAYFVLRIFVGLIFIGFGVKHARARKELVHIFNTDVFPGTPAAVLLIACEIVIGGMFVLGFYTQIAALVTMALSLTLIIFRKYLGTALFGSRTLYALLFGCALSLFITGAGALAFDLPL